MELIVSQNDKPLDDGLTQSERFKQAARELECDDDPEHFAALVKKLGKAGPAPAKGLTSAEAGRESTSAKAGKENDDDKAPP